MSICRWGHKSDVYIYQAADCDEETFVIHVRGMTATEDSQGIPTLDDILDDTEFKKGTDAIKHYLELQKEVKWKPLQSIYAENAYTTTTWSVDSVEELADLLYSMQEDGVRIPPHAFTAVVTMLCEKE